MEAAGPNTSEKANLPKQYQPDAVEDRWRDFWVRGGYFKADPDAPGEPYTIVIPPPNVTGVLHMGHGLDETIQDTLIRYHRMAGFNTLWVPGTDHAGIATQNVVVKKLLAEGKRRQDMGREAFLEEVWTWKEEHGSRIVEQLKSLGCSCDWSREAFTLDEDRARAVRECFKALYDRGLIYRGEYLVNWDPVDLTAVSDDEVENEPETGHLWHMRYPLEDGSGHVTVATTRPETMLGDTAVAVNPTDERYTHLIGKNVRLPFVDRLIPVIADDFVKKDFGSGCVKITPAHDPNDFLCGQRHDLPMITVLTEDAHVNEHGGPYQGLDRYAAREKIVADLKELGLLERIEEHEHVVPRGYRSKSVIEPRLSKQWFVKIGPLAEKALAAVNNGDIRILPGSPYKDIYNNWMTNVRDWCISRQLWWGHRIPIWYRKDDPETIVCYGGEGLPPEVEADPDGWVQDPDVLDTWFSSALWPFSTLGWPGETKDMAKYYPTSVLVTGHDILFFWVARMIMFGVELTGKVPFKDVYLHGLVFGKTYYERKGADLHIIPPAISRAYDLGEKDVPKNVESKWEKMSKSKGNVIDPLQVIDDYGTDALRLTVAAYAALGRNIDLDWRRFESYRNFVNKLWNASRFVMMVTEPLTPEQYRAGLKRETLEAEDRWILTRLTETIEEATRCLDHYEFDKYAAALYDFTWNEYCAWYVEMAKRRAYSDATEGAAAESATAARVVLVTVLENLCRLLHPVMPFVTEEIWHILRERLADGKPGVAGEARPPAPGAMAAFADGFAAPSLCVAPWPAADASAKDVEACATVDLWREVIGAVRNIRGEMKVPVEMKVAVTVQHADAAALAKLEPAKPIIEALASAEGVTLGAAQVGGGLASTYVSGDLTVLVPLPADLVEQERARLEKELAFTEKGIDAGHKKLSNESFVSRAPEAVVAKEREKLDKLEADAAALREKLAALGGA
ncbi:MAG: valine--tRNA ligase [Sumerlaeia bacterium]